VLGGCDEHSALMSIEVCDLASMNSNVTHVHVNIHLNSNNNKTSSNEELRWIILLISLPMNLYSFATFNIKENIYIIGGKTNTKEKNNHIWRMGSDTFEQVMCLEGYGDSVKEPV